MGNELFDTSSVSREPLAARMRARNLDEYIGQDHILGEGRLLRRCIARDRLSSVIFYGPPGVGKTTLARVIANHTKSAFITLNAVLTGVADIRAAIKDATDYYSLYSRRTILFVDEVHRWSKSQQDALLPYVENGTVILIGATTENPFFEVNRALVSRSRIFQLKPLTREDLKKIAEQALGDSERGYGKWNVEFEEGALDHIIDSSSGDARNLLNALELAVETTPSVWNPGGNPPQPAPMSTIYITKKAAEESIQKKVVLYDKDGDYHYDVISAFIKSLRGRDPDAALYYLARMVSAGEDPHFIFRRMLISSCEDTGLSDPNAITIVNSCAQAFDRVGLPEGRYFLAHAALYLSTAPKSNSSMAFFDALKVIEATDSLNAANSDVPNHLKDPTRDAKGFGHGIGYKYPHEYTNHWVAQQYLPRELVGKVFYTPSDQGYEGKIRAQVLSRRESQLAVILQDLSANQTGQKPSADPSGFDDFEEGESFAPDKVSSATGSTNINSFDNTGTKGANFDGKSASGTGDANPKAEGGSKGNFDVGKTDLGASSINVVTNKTFDDEENLTYSPPDERKESALNKADRAWRARIDENRAETLLFIRSKILERAKLIRNTRVLVWNADDGLLLWEAVRRCPEGVVAGVCRNERSIEILNQYAATLDEMDKPLLFLRREQKDSAQKAPKSDNDAYLSGEAFNEVLINLQYRSLIFDRILFYNPFTTLCSIEALADALKFVTVKSDARKGKVFLDEKATTTVSKTGAAFLQEEDSLVNSSLKATVPPGFAIVAAQRIPCATQHLSRLIQNQVLTAQQVPSWIETLAPMDDAESAFFSDKENPMFSWDEETIKNTFASRGFSCTSEVFTISEKRRIKDEDISRWFDAEKSPYGEAIRKKIGTVKMEAVAQLLQKASKKQVFDWSSKVVFFTINSP